jgi:hypothetical protein
MAAKNNNGNGRRNFYTISYGKLSTRVKELTEGVEAITEADLKSATTNVDNLDLRNKYVEKTGDFPYVVFYDTIEGKIQSVAKSEFDQGVSLHLELLDSDDELSTVQVRFYSKYAENLLNRLSNLKGADATVSLTPYAIPSEFTTPEGKKVKLYNQGVSVKVNGEKLEVAFKNDDTKLPKTQQFKNAQGKTETSRVDRIEFLFNEVASKFKDVEKQEPTKKDEPKPVTDAGDVADDDLPF